jgi:hydroxymethylpyrimidine pyrophosphatase-like HAD family hydrolase
MTQYTAIATDYDGTLAHDGKVDDTTMGALVRAREAGLLTILVTGRELADLFNTFQHSDLFTRIVAENGAVVYDPATQMLNALSTPPPPGLVERLAKQSVPVSVGHTIVATVKPHEHAVLAAIRDLGIEWHIIFNKGAVMALPTNVTKATGLAAVLGELGVAPEHVVGIGDAENDQAFLDACGLSVAVANALPAVKANADVVTNQPRGAGVTELIERLLRNEAIEVTRPRRA